MITDFEKRLLKLMAASPEQLEAIDRILDGKIDQPRPAANGPLLLGMGAAAKLLGISRPTLWRMLRAGRLEAVEILPGSRRVRRADVEAVAAGNQVGLDSARRRARA